MTETERQAAEFDTILDRERARQTELRRIVAAGGAVWDDILGRWMEVGR